jgi:regulator of protease activity HflC (stomatin/prohibitin superfamily)
MAAAILLFWSFPAWIGKLTAPVITTILRWAIFIGGVFLAARIFGNKGQRRTYLVALLLSLTLLLGWWIDRWVGIIFITLPILFAFFWTVQQAAQISLPASPAGSRDGWTKTKLLLSYSCGIQRPMFMGDDEKKKAPEKRIDGKPGSKLPGLIWMPSHAVVGISSGNKFERVEGPGSVYTDKFEQPFQAVDLRSQLWSSEIDVMTRDGIGFRLEVHACFRIDPRTWSDEEYNRLKQQNSFLRGGNSFKNAKNHYRYVPARVMAALGTTAIKKQETDTILYWDDRVAGVIEEATRNSVSEVDLDDLWSPTEDGQSAQFQLAGQIQNRASPLLQRTGVQLESIRIDRIVFPEGKKQPELDQVSTRKLASWSDRWEGERSNILAEAQAESERIQQEARAYAESMLLSSIAEGLEKTQKIHPRLPRYVIAMRFLSALQEYIHRQKDDDGRIEETENLLLQWQKKYSDSDQDGERS